MKRALTLLAGVVCLTLGSTQSRAAIFITVGNYLLAPNTAGQTIDIFVSGNGLNGDATVAGVNFIAQVGDGGPEIANAPLNCPAGTVAPTITGVDLKTGTIFAGVSDSPVDQGSLPQVVAWSLANSIPANDPSPNGKLVTLTIDTSGFNSGSWPLALSGVLSCAGGYTTDFSGLNATIINGSITVPEPATYAGMFGALCLAGAAVTRKFRR